LNKCFCLLGDIFVLNKYYFYLYNSSKCTKINLEKHSSSVIIFIYLKICHTQIKINFIKIIVFFSAFSSHFSSMIWSKISIQFRFYIIKLKKIEINIEQTIECCLKLFFLEMKYLTRHRIARWSHTTWSFFFLLAEVKNV